MIIKRAIGAVNDNPLYYEFIELFSSAWNNFNIKPAICVVGNVALPKNGAEHIFFDEIEGIPTGFISQISRLIAPCFFPEEVSLIADIDMMPLSKKYFTNSLKEYKDDDILVLTSDAYENQVRYPMCYIAAKGKYFQEIIGLKSLDKKGIETFIKDLFALKLGWDTDELFFAKKLHESIHLDKTLFLKRGDFKTNRLDRSYWFYNRKELLKDKYIDSHLLRPYSENIGGLKDVADFINAGSSRRKYFLFIAKSKLLSFWERK